MNKIWSKSPSKVQPQFKTECNQHQLNVAYLSWFNTYTVFVSPCSNKQVFPELSQYTEPLSKPVVAPGLKRKIEIHNTIQTHSLSLYKSLKLLPPLIALAQIYISFYSWAMRTSQILASKTDFYIYKNECRWCKTVTIVFELLSVMCWLANNNLFCLTTSLLLGFNNS